MTGAAVNSLKRVQSASFFLSRCSRKAFQASMRRKVSGHPKTHMPQVAQLSQWLPPRRARVSATFNRCSSSSAPRPPALQRTVLSST